MENLKKSKAITGNTSKTRPVSGILKQVQNQDVPQTRDPGEQFTPHFSSRMVLSQNQFRKFSRESHQSNNSKQNLRYSSKGKVDASNKLNAVQSTHSLRKKNSKQRNPTKSNSDISNVYQEDAHRALFATQNSGPHLQIPIGAAAIFKRNIYNKPNVSDYLTCESTDDDPGQSSAERPLRFSHLSNE